jgi:hypothetical protein
LRSWGSFLEVIVEGLDCDSTCLQRRVNVAAKIIIAIPGRIEDANPESRDSGSGPSDHPGMTEEN